MTEIELIPRARGSQTEKGSPLLELGFIDDDGDWHSVEDGRVLAGPVAYLLKNARASLIKTDEPWQLARWGAGGIIPLTGPGMTPARRDQLSRELRAVGVPEEDFSLLAVHRGPPDKFIVYVWQPDLPDAIVVQVKLEAEYQGVRVPASHAVESNAVHIEVPDTERLIERDLASEDEARTRLRRLGFKYSREADAFVGRGELALNALDRDRSIFRVPGRSCFHRRRRSFTMTSSSPPSSNCSKTVGSWTSRLRFMSPIRLRRPTIRAKQSPPSRPLSPS